MKAKRLHLFESLRRRVGIATTASSSALPSLLTSVPWAASVVARRARKAWAIVEVLGPLLGVLSLPAASPPSILAALPLRRLSREFVDRNLNPWNCHSHISGSVTPCWRKTSDNPDMRASCPCSLKE